MDHLTRKDLKLGMVLEYYHKQGESSVLHTADRIDKFKNYESTGEHFIHVTAIALLDQHTTDAFVIGETYFENVDSYLLSIRKILTEQEVLILQL